MGLICPVETLKYSLLLVIWYTGAIVGHGIAEL